MRAAIYTRISADPKGQGLGVARQEADCREYCVRQGWEVVEVYQDNDVSATKRAPRPAYQRMLAAVRAGEVDAIVAWAYDRLCRRIVDLEEVLDLVEERGLSLGCVSGDLNLATPMGRTLARVVTSIAAGEVETLKARVRAKQRELADAGKVGNGGRRPYGYTSSRTEVIEEEAEIVREIARRILAGESMRSIAADLNARGVPPARGERWSPTGVRAVVTKPHGAGLRVYRGQIHGEGTWPAILDRDTWEAVVGVVQHPGRKLAPGHAARKHLLSGIASCGLCHAPLGINYGPAGARYRCTGCGRVSRAKDHLETYVVEYALELLSNLPPAPPPETGGVRVATETAALAERRRQLVEDYATLGLSAEELKRGLARIDARLAELEAERARVTQPYVLDDSLRGLTLADWEKLPLSRHRAILARLLTVEVHPKTVRGGNVFDTASIVCARRAV